MLIKLQKFNKIFLRVTWVLLAIGSIDHFSCEFEATKFACENLPHEIAQYNLKLLWVMVVIVGVGEIVAWILKRREAREANAG
ncbi:MAG: hypothetical protein HON14_04340 [Rhodospirillaceae bacterium]|jgi:hypothetical protein|nr:hypothetical protein [Rhodospirillaceae bacterium]MBT4589443.1 hypothetical protein [Rhodospirillaceae bacterium]MBT4938338.1 hypothetical protein [Rhodospirillaceae bacterium]MBT5941013.1 hypothetical protein [Rhodospirillaceae bacterium]MBT7267473.1 hypothetical protein [Rhodospirillaceae bacterium]